MRGGMIDTEGIRRRWECVGSKFDERGRRMFAAGEVRAAGWGGLKAACEITGLASSTIGRGQKDLDAAALPKGRVRRKGGGRQHLASRDATLIADKRRVVAAMVADLVEHCAATPSFGRNCTILFQAKDSVSDLDAQSLEKFNWRTLRPQMRRAESPRICLECAAS